MTIKILIIEDDPVYVITLERLLDTLGYEEIQTTDNSEEALTLVQLHQPDLILMDIDIKGNLNGIQLAEKIKDIPLIYITAFDNPSIYEKARQTKPIAYLVKPFNELTLQSTIEFAVAKMVHKDMTTKNYRGWVEDILVKDCFFIKMHGQLQKVKISEIRYIQSDGNYCFIQTLYKKYASKISLTKIKDKLPLDNFIQIHRRYIVPINFIDSIQMTDQTVMVGKFELPLGKSYKANLMGRLNLL